MNDGGCVSNYFPTHVHTQYSVLDAMGTVDEAVEIAVRNGWAGLGLTDHGTMAGVLRLYKSCRKADIMPYPGSEWYLVRDVYDESHRENRYHLIMMALTERGFHALIQLSSRSHSRDRFHRKPLIDLHDLAALKKSGLSDDIAVTTACYFGIVTQTLINKGYKAAKRVTQMLAKWFPNTLFMEVQNHWIVHEDGGRTIDYFIVKDLMKIADELGLPVVAGVDSHYMKPSQKPVHDLMKDICYFGDGEDNRFPGDSFHLGSTNWVAGHYSPEMWSRIEEGHAHLLGLHDLTLPELDTYKFHVPSMGSRFPMEKLRRMCKKGMEYFGFDGWGPYEEQLRFELKVIEEMGMANYFILFEDLLGYARRNGIFYNVRGSANGSLVCYVLRITNVDPVARGTFFDRFMSLDRKKPPDIDVDIESEGRDLLVDYARQLFPTLVQIGTYGRIGITQADTAEESGKGSVYVQYMAAMRRKLGDAFTGRVLPEHRYPLEQLALTPVRKSAGAHAGGFVFPGDDHPIDKYLATMLIPSSNTTVTQAVMEDVEDAGYLKGDFLGLRSLGTMRRCIEAIGKDVVKDGMHWIPDDDKAACKLLSEGRTDTGIFQFEGYTTAKGAKEMKIRSTQDAILCLALYRPAMTDSGLTARYLANRAAKKVDKINAAIDSLLDDTYGVPVFQEHVIEIMRRGGLDYENLNDILKAVKASNDKITEYAQATFKRVEPIYIRCAVNNGFTPEEARKAWSHVVGFSDYGFNKGHATAYGLMGYRMAYLKAHHPVEFMAALLATWAGKDKEKMYVQEARRMGLTIGRPNINSSDVLWSATPEGVIRRGLVSVKHVGREAAAVIVSEREANGPYLSMDDFIDRVPARPVSGGTSWKRTGKANGVIGHLVAAGAFKILGVTS